MEDEGRGCDGIPIASCVCIVRRGCGLVGVSFIVLYLALDVE